MAIRLSGINSGLDTDALVQELVSAYSLKTEKYEKQKTKTEWKKESWQNLNTKIYGLYTKISNLRYDSSYNLKKVNVSDSTKATVTASSNAVIGTQQLKINQTAQASYITGAKLGGGIKTSSTLADLGYTGDDTSIELRGVDGSTHEIKVTKDTKISEIITQMKDAGYNASFDENNQRFFVSAKETGTDHDFSICSTDENSQNLLSLMGLDSSLFEINATTGELQFSSAGAAYQEALDLQDAATENGYASITEYLSDLVSGYKTTLTTAQEDIAEAQAVIDEYEDLVAHKEARTAHNTMYAALSKAGLSVSDGVGIDSSTLYKLSKEFYNKSEIKASDIEEYLTENNITLPEGKTAEDLATFLNDNKEAMKTVASYDGNVISKKLDAIESEITALQSDYDEAKTTLSDAQATIAEIRASDYAELTDLTDEEFAARCAAYEDTATEAASLKANAEVSQGGAIKVVGQDAIIELNGAIFTSASNSFSINGLTIEAHAVTDGMISISTAVDTQGIYDKIKDFLKEYNTVINEITKLYNADSASDYEPLTDEEKDAMSETEIEKWETKIKDSLLRRDTSLNSIMSGMINSMASTYEVNGQKLSLSTFGISTLGFLNAPENEQYAFHIDGDKDDEKTAGNNDKLMAAIQNDADQVIDFIKQLTTSLYNSIDSRMKSTELSSAYKVYNDKEIDSDIEDIEDLIEKWEDKVADMEDYYYGKFSDMEVSLSKLQSQTNSLTSMLG